MRKLGATENRFSTITSGQKVFICNFRHLNNHRYNISGGFGGLLGLPTNFCHTHYGSLDNEREEKLIHIIIDQAWPLPLVSFFFPSNNFASLTEFIRQTMDKQWSDLSFKTILPMASFPPCHFRSFPVLRCVISCPSPRALWSRMEKTQKK